MIIMSLVGHTYYSIRDVILPKRIKQNIMLSVSEIIRFPTEGIIIKIRLRKVERSRKLKKGQTYWKTKRKRIEANTMMT